MLKPKAAKKKWFVLNNIIIPNVNDTKEDVNKWLDDTQRIGIQQVIIDFEADWLSRNTNNIPTYIDDLFLYMVDKIKQRGLDIQYYGVANQYKKLKGLDTEGYGLHQE